MTTSGSAFHLAQVNIGRTRGEMTDPVMADFAAALPAIKALAERTPGFVWRLQTEDGDATAIRPYEDNRILINLSVWTDLAHGPTAHAFGFATPIGADGLPIGRERGGRHLPCRLRRYSFTTSIRPSRRLNQRNWNQVLVG